MDHRGRRAQAYGATSLPLHGCIGIGLMSKRLRCGNVQAGISPLSLISTSLLSTRSLNSMSRVCPSPRMILSSGLSVPRSLLRLSRRLTHERAEEIQRGVSREHIVRGQVNSADDAGSVRPSDDQV